MIKIVDTMIQNQGKCRLKTERPHLKMTTNDQHGSKSFNNA